MKSTLRVYLLAGEPTRSKTHEITTVGKLSFLSPASKKGVQRARKGSDAYINRHLDEQCAIVH
jgi:hypothetical protein